MAKRRATTSKPKGGPPVDATNKERVTKVSGNVKTPKPVASNGITGASKPKKAGKQLAAGDRDGGRRRKGLPVDIEDDDDTEDENEDDTEDDDDGVYNVGSGSGRIRGKEIYCDNEDDGSRVTEPDECTGGVVLGNE